MPARSERPTALTLVLPGRTAAAICKAPTPKQVAGNGEGHAEPGIGVDIGRADEALHQRVGDAIILRQRLAGKIEGDGIRPMLGNSGPEFFRHEIERLIPAGTPPSDSRVKQPVPGPRSSRQAPIPWSRDGRNSPVIRIAGNFHAAIRFRPGDHTAADPAVGTGGLDRGADHALHRRNRFTRPARARRPALSVPRRRNASPQCGNGSNKASGRRR